MYRLDYLARQDIKIPNYINEEYLAFQIWQLGNIFQDTLIAIKDSALNFVAINNSYATEFQFDQVPDTNNIQSLNNEKLSTAEICNQERSILENQKFQDSIFLYKANNTNSISAYLMRKRPIINPSNNHVVGILIAAKKQKIGEFRSLFLKQLFGINKKMQLTNLDTDLNDHQHKIILCLLYGYHSRKEITGIL